MQTGCQIKCHKLKDKVDSSPGLETQDIERSLQKSGANKSILNNRRSPSQSQKSVQIGGVTSVEVTDSFRLQRLHSPKSSSERTPVNSVKDHHINVSEGRNASSKSSPQVPTSNQKSERTRTNLPKESPIKNGRMSSGSRVTSDQDPAWNSSSHDPCPPTCPMTQARERAIRKAELRQERLDDYLLNKGFRYFDDICTCSSICLINQLRKDKFVTDMIKSACLFGLGVKLCDELDSWNLFS